MPKGTGTKARNKKELTEGEKVSVKLKAKGKLGDKVAEEVQKVRTTRMRRQTSTDAFGTLKHLSKPAYTSFPPPRGAKSETARGCKTATVTLGPLVGWPESNDGTDAEAVWPSAILDVRTELHDEKYHWKSGHVINADFGGFGGSDENMTCLTSSANTRQTKFDNNVRVARMHLHHVYTALRDAGNGSTFFSGFGYGIQVDIEMSDDAWGTEYPANCVSNSMSLEATIVGEPSEEAVRAAMAGSTGITISQVLTNISAVQRFIGIANTRQTVFNVK